jgi:hypothetical protein
MWPTYSGRIPASAYPSAPTSSTDHTFPRHTDTIIAKRFTQRLVNTYGDRHALWALPIVPYGLSLEHTWSPGTSLLRPGPARPASCSPSPRTMSTWTMPSVIVRTGMVHERAVHAVITGIWSSHPRARPSSNHRRPRPSTRGST